MTCIALPRLSAKTRIETPLGTLTAAATELGLAGLWFDGQSHHPGTLDAPEDPTHRHLAATHEALAAYWDGQPGSPCDVALDLRGTAFQRAVWQALRALPAGQTVSYGQLAKAAGAPAAVRAVGAAIGRNPVSVIVPCHRVIGGNGALTGYAGGIDRKRALLQLEGWKGRQPEPGLPH